MKKVYVLLFFTILLLNSFAQSNLQIRYDYDAAGNANFVADNFTNVPVYVVLNFSYLENASFSEDLPYIKRIKPGTSPLFSIYREIDQPSPQFNIEVKWFMAHPSPEVDPEFPYLIPTVAGTEVVISSALVEKNSRSVGFEIIGSVEICASRKGIIVKVIGNNNPELPIESGKQFNSVQLLHEDGTIGEYFNFAFRGISCNV
ncbi:MAG: hypothetical protein HQ541_11595, partial [Mariniphaga sp.]|nr:hypothetical protein [Mariniphaga sp.]